MRSIFHIDTFTFPYLYKFPGQASDEKILYIGREHEAVLWWRRLQVLLISLVLVLSGTVAQSVFTQFSARAAESIWLLCTLAAFLVLAVGWWWTTTIWKHSVFVLTTRRLLKFIYSTPYTKHTLTLPLEMIVDTGSYTKGMLQSFLKMGTFTARSSAASSGVATDEPNRVNKKYFYLENIAVAEDFQHYLNKVLRASHSHPDKLDTFRPFLPGLKGERRREFMQQFPEYWS